MRWISLASCLGCLASLAACGGGDSSTPDANEALACVESGRGDIYAVGLEHMGSGGKLDFKLMSATPAPPARNINAWQLQINQVTGGAAAAGASLIVTPFMPDHQHGAGAHKVVSQESSTTPGLYDLSDINMWMPGYWEVTIDATLPDSSHDTVIYKFCIQA